MKYLQGNFIQHILQLHLKILLDKRSKFVGTKTLFYALKTVQISIKHKHTRHFIQDHMQTILFELTIPLMLLTQHEFNEWSDNPVEYIRMQVDQSDSYSIKTIVRALVNSICSIKANRKQKISIYLQQFLELIAQNMQTATDFRIKEALMHILGNLKEPIEGSVVLKEMMESMLSKFASFEL